MEPEFLLNHTDSNRNKEIDVYSFSFFYMKLLQVKIHIQIMKISFKNWSQNPIKRPTFDEIVEELETNPDFYNR